VSFGAGGAVLGDEDGRRWRYRPPAVEVAGPIGSGDSLTAGTLARLARGAEMPEAVAFGIACAAANCLNTDPARLNAADAERLLAGVQMDEMA